MGKLLIFDTHPIQYRSPVFASLAAKHPDTKVYYFDDAFDGKRWWFHEVGKIPVQNWDLELRGGFANATVGSRALGLRRTFLKLRSILRDEKPAQVALYGYYLPEHWMLRLLCGWYGIPLVFVGETFQSGARSLRRWIKEPLRAFFFSGVSSFISIGEKTRAYYSKLGISEDRLVCAKYCVDLKFFTQSQEETAALRKAWRRRLHIPEDAFVTLFVGRLFERKRPQDVLALHRYCDLDPLYHTVIVGNGPLEEALRKESQDDENYHWLGFQNQALTREAYCGSDVLFVPSEFETWGLVVNEAAACGIPSVLTDTCGVAGDLIVQGETGFVFSVGDLPAASSAIHILKDTPGLAKRMGLEAQRRVHQNYSIDQFAEAFIRALAAGSAKVTG